MVSSSMLKRVPKKSGNPRKRLRPGILKCEPCDKLFPAGTEACSAHPERKLVFADGRVGTLVQGKYEVQEQIGVGGMATVYRAQANGDLYALKLLHPEKCQKQSRKRFYREAEEQFRIDHPHFLYVLVFVHCDKTNENYIAMELISGRTLKEEVAEVGRFTALRATGVIVQVLGALEAAHGNGILHRDLKPHNVMVSDDADGEEFTRVIDFGGRPIDVSGVETPWTILTKPGTLFGTPAYMSPEQAAGDPLDERSDVFSAATLFSFMLLGRSPFLGSDIGESIQNILGGTVPSFEEESPPLTVPKDILRILRRAHSVKPDERFQSAHDFRLALLDSPALKTAGSPCFREVLRYLGMKKD